MDHQKELNKVMMVSLAIKVTRSISTPLPPTPPDGMLVHHRVTPAINLLYPFNIHLGEVPRGNSYMKQTGNKGDQPGHSSSFLLPIKDAKRLKISLKCRRFSLGSTE